MNITSDNDNNNIDSCNRVIKYYQNYKIEYHDNSGGVMHRINLKFDKKDIWEWLDNNDEITEKDGLYLCSKVPKWLENTKVIPFYNGDLVIKHLVETDIIKTIESFNDFDRVKKTEYLLTRWINPEWEKLKNKCTVKTLLQRKVYPSGLYLSKKM